MFRGALCNVEIFARDDEIRGIGAARPFLAAMWRKGGKGSVCGLDHGHGRDVGWGRESGLGTVTKSGGHGLCGELVVHGAAHAASCGHGWLL